MPSASVDVHCANDSSSFPCVSTHNDCSSFKSSVNESFRVSVTEFVSMETVPDIDTDSFNDNDNVAFSELLRHPYRSDADSSPIVPISDVPIPPKVPSSEAPSMFATNDDDLIRYFVRGSSGSYSHAPSIVVTSGSAFVSSSIPPSVSRYMSNPSTTSTVFPSSSQLGTSTVPSGGTPSTAPFESFTQASGPSSDAPTTIPLTSTSTSRPVVLPLGLFLRLQFQKFLTVLLLKDKTLLLPKLADASFHPMYLLFLLTESLFIRRTVFTNGNTLFNDILASFLHS